MSSQDSESTYVRKPERLQRKEHCKPWSIDQAGGNVTVSWQSVAGVNYFLERCTNLSSLSTLTNSVIGGTNMVLVASNIAGQAVTTTCADTNATGRGPFFYRVGVRYP